MKIFSKLEHDGHIFLRLYILYRLISQFLKANPFTKIKKIQYPLIYQRLRK